MLIDLGNFINLKQDSKVNSLENSPKLFKNNGDFETKFAQIDLNIDKSNLKDDSTNQFKAQIANSELSSQVKQVLNSEGELKNSTVEPKQILKSIISHLEENNGTKKPSVKNILKKLDELVESKTLKEKIQNLLEKLDAIVNNDSVGDKAVNLKNLLDTLKDIKDLKKDIKKLYPNLKTDKEDLKNLEIDLPPEVKSAFEDLKHVYENLLSKLSELKELAPDKAELIEKNLETLDELTQLLHLLDIQDKPQSKESGVKELVDTDGIKQEINTKIPENKKEIVETISPENKKEIVETISPENKKEIVETISPENRKEIVETISPESKEFAKTSEEITLLLKQVAQLVKESPDKFSEIQEKLVQIKEKSALLVENLKVAPSKGKELLKLNLGQLISEIQHNITQKTDVKNTPTIEKIIPVIAKLVVNSEKELKNAKLELDLKGKLEVLNARIEKIDNKETSMVEKKSGIQDIFSHLIKPKELYTAKKQPGKIISGIANLLNTDKFDKKTLKDLEINKNKDLSTKNIVNLLSNKESDTTIVGFSTNNNTISSDKIANNTNIQYTNKPGDVVNQVINKIKNNLGKSEIQIALNPNNLGSVKVSISLQRGVLVANMLAETIKAADSLKSGVESLRQTLAESGLNVGKIVVSSSDSASSSNNFTNSNQNGENSQPGNKNSSFQNAPDQEQNEKAMELFQQFKDANSENPANNKNIKSEEQEKLETDTNSSEETISTDNTLDNYIDLDNGIVDYKV